MFILCEVFNHWHHDEYRKKIMSAQLNRFIEKMTNKACTLNKIFHKITYVKL